MELAKLYNLILAAIIWGATLYIVKPTRIVKYLPVGLWALGILVTDFIVHRIVNLHWFKAGYVMIAGIPLFAYVYGLGAGVLMGYIIDKSPQFKDKILAISLFTVADMAIYYGNIYFGNMGSNPIFTISGKIYHDLVIFATFTWVASYILKITVHKETIR